MAFCPDRPNGSRYVYYDSFDADPRDARWVRCNGEKRELEPEAMEIDKESVEESDVDPGSDTVGWVNNTSITEPGNESDGSV
jgi:hypothetical protein